jgi:hypothetical protein
VWLGAAFAPVFFVGFWVIAGFIPPPSPGHSAEQVARMFADDRNRIRIGLWVTTGASPLLAFFVAAISNQLRRAEGPRGPMATVQAISGALIVLEFLFPLLVWQTAAYRTERSAESIQLLNDLAWLPFVGIVGTFMVQALVIGIVILRDDRANPVFPRWIAYVNFWAALGVAGGSMVVFVHDGPLAWNGIIAWWLLLVAFFVWMVTMIWALLRAISAEDAAGRSSGAESAVV